MTYRELEKFAAWASGLALAGISAAVEALAGWGIIEVMFMTALMIPIGAGLFVHITDTVTAVRERRYRARRRRKQVDFVVGRPVKGMPGYVEVR